MLNCHLCKTTMNEKTTPFFCCSALQNLNKITSSLSYLIEYILQLLWSYLFSTLISMYIVFCVTFDGKKLFIVTLQCYAFFASVLFIVSRRVCAVLFSKRNKLRCDPLYHIWNSDQVWIGKEIGKVLATSSSAGYIIDEKAHWVLTGEQLLQDKSKWLSYFHQQSLTAKPCPPSVIAKIAFDDGQTFCWKSFPINFWMLVNIYFGLWNTTINSEFLVTFFKFWKCRWPSRSCLPCDFEGFARC